MNAPQALYWYHQQPRTADYRNSSANRTGPYITELDMTGQPGVFKLVKYVPEETVADAVLAEGVAEYERGLRDGAALESKKVAMLLASLKDVISWVPGREKWHTDEPIKAVERARAVISVTVKESLTAGQQDEATP